MRDDETTLLAQWREGDPSAGLLLLRRQVAPLRRYFSRRIGGGADGEDLVQRTLVASFEALPRFREAVGFAQWEEGGSSMTLIDDPAASVGVGPNAWLVQVNASADYIGTYQFDGGSCSVGCGWCGPGESLCHSGLNENAIPEGCMACVPFDQPDILQGCADFINACMSAGDAGLDETGGNDDTGGTDGGVDETGSGLGETGDGMNDPDDAFEYDCSLWDPAGAVTLDEYGNAVVDAAIVEEIAIHYGDPLADCDDTSFSLRSDGYFAVGTMASNGLLAQLGLLPGDAILAIDGEPMTDLDTIATTTVDLFLGHRVTSGFTLAIGRGRKTIARSVRVR